MPSRPFLLLPAVSALALSLACGGTSTGASSAKKAGATVKKEVPPASAPAALGPLAVHPTAITCAPGDPILLLPVQGTLGERWNSGTFKLEGEDVETGRNRTVTPSLLAGPGQPVFSCGGASDAAGTTHLRIRARVGDAWSEPCTVAVTVQPVSPETILRVAPSAATVAPGGRIVFRGFPSKAAGVTATTTAFATATAGSGTILPVGRELYLYEAPKAPGTYQLVMTHIPDGARTQVQVTVAEPAS